MIVPLSNDLLAVRAEQLP